MSYTSVVNMFGKRRRWHQYAVVIPLDRVNVVVKYCRTLEGAEAKAASVNLSALRYGITGKPDIEVVKVEDL